MSNVVDKILSRMQDQGEFPALPAAVERVRSTLQQERAGVAELSAAILSDLSLTQRVLRLANSALYYPVTGRRIATVSQAVMILGNDTIANLALSLEVVHALSRFSKPGSAASEELARSVLAAAFTKRLTRDEGIRESEEAVVCALLHDLGSVLLAHYMPDEWTQVVRLQKQGQTRAAACREVLGVSPAVVGLSVAEKWRLPGLVVQSISPWVPRPLSAALSHEEWLRAVSQFSHDLAALTFESNDPAERRKLAASYAPALTSAPEVLIELATAGEQDPDIQEFITEMLGDLLPVANKGVGDPFLRWQSEWQARLEQGPAAMLGQRSKVCDELLALIGASQLVIYSISAGQNRYEARWVHGPPIETSLAFEAAFAPDVLHLALRSLQPLLLADCRAPEVRSRLPQWFQVAFPEARTLALFPLVDGLAEAPLLLQIHWSSTRTDGGAGLRERLRQAALLVAACIAADLQATNVSSLSKA